MICGRGESDGDYAFTELMWSENQISLALDQSLILAMEDESRWMIKNNLTAERQVPSFLDYIMKDAWRRLSMGW